MEVSGGEAGYEVGGGCMGISIRQSASMASRIGKIDKLGMSDRDTNLIVPNRIQYLQRLTHIDEIARVVQIQKRSSENSCLHTALANEE